MTGFNVSLPRVDFQPSMFEDLINQRGVQIRWEKAALCTCVRADTSNGKPSFNCGVCYNGNIYVDPLVINAAITNITGQRNAQVFGELALGGIFVTVAGQNRLGMNDRITLLNQTMRYAELCNPASAVLKVTANPSDTAITVDQTRKFPLPIQNFCTVEIAGQTIRYTGKTATQLTGIPSSGTGSIQQPITAGATVQLMEWLLRYPPETVFDARPADGPLIEDVDYEIVDGRRIRLLTNNPLPQFTVLYDAQPVYLVDSLSHEFRDQLLTLGMPDGAPQLARLPVAAVCRKDWINRTG